MFRYLVRRVLGAAVILLIVTVTMFYLFFAVPRDPARAFCTRTCSEETLQIIKRSFSFDKPIWVQFWEWLSGIFVGRDTPLGHCNAPCLGFSFYSRDNILDTILDRAPVTLSLTFGAAVVTVSIGVGAGLLAAAKQGTLIDSV